MITAFRISAIFLLATVNLFASESVFVKLHVDNLPQMPVVLEQISGDRRMPVDTVQSSADGTLMFTMSEKCHAGMYAVSAQNMPIWEFIYNHASVEARVSLGAPFESAQILQSDENTIYYRFIRKQNLILSKAEAVKQVIDNYPASEDFYAHAVSEYGKILAEQNDVLTEAIGNGRTIVATFAKASTELLVPLSIPQAEQAQYLQAHYWDLMPTDTILKYSSLLTHKALQYYSLFVPKGQGARQTQQAYLQATDSILEKFMPYPVLYNFIANYLMDGFEGIGQEYVADFIAEKYAELNSCEGKDHLSTLETKVYNRTKLKVGTSAPAFSLVHDKETYKYTDQTTLLIFWATWCHHCTETMPQLSQLLPVKKYSNIDIVTVSLDKDEQAWLAFIETNGLSMYQNFITGGWDAKIVKDYAVYGTPTIYLLQNGVIVGKPVMFDQLPSLIDQL